jgi:2-keto-3-deoxy-L-rhamnonate aldolase RhmA
MHAPLPSLAATLAERSVLGTFVSLRDPAVVSLCAAAGFQTVIVDGEHGAMNPETVGHLVTAAHASRIPAIVRLGVSFRYVVQQALESGADAVMAPMVESAEQAEAFASFCRYPPRGTRGFHALTGGSAFGAVPAPNLVTFANDRMVTLAQIETARGLEHCEAIARAKGVDMLFLGPVDLSLSLGVPPGSQAIREASARVAQAAKAAGKLFGSFVGSEAEAREAVALGARLVVASSDTHWLLQSTRNACTAFVSIVGGP